MVDDTKKLENNFLKEKNKAVHKVEALKRVKEKELNIARSEFDKLKQKQAHIQKKLDDVLRVISTFKLQMEESLKKNFEHKKNLIDLNVLKSKIPKQIRSLQKRIKQNIKIINSSKKTLRKISSRKNKVLRRLRELDYLVNRAESFVSDLADRLKDLSERQKHIIEGKVTWKPKTALSEVSTFVKKHILPTPEKKPVKKKVTKKKPVKKKVAKKKPTKNKSVKKR